MPSFHDQVLGKVIVSRGRSAKYVRLGVTTAGDIKVSAPLFTPMYFIKNFVKKSRTEVSQMITKYRSQYTQSETIGKSHSLAITSSNEPSHVSYKKPHILVNLHTNDDILNEAIQSEIRAMVVKALRIEAKAYLPRKVQHIASTYGFEYRNLRFSHAKGRWGSCNNDGTISLNIALMKLSFELIDYVIIHELAHTRYLNHSAEFWDQVENCDPDYKTHRKVLKNHSPHI